MMSSKGHDMEMEEKTGLKFQGPLTGLDLVSWLTVISSVVKKHMKVTE